MLLAIREHDNGWQEPDALPQVDANGRPYDFISVPPNVRQGVWPRGVGRLADRPYAAALVAHHAITVYERFRADPSWRPHFDGMTLERDRSLARAGCEGDRDRRMFQEDYELLRLSDLLSLTFCNGWTDTVEFAGCRALLAGDTLSITPDPFGGVVMPLRVRARRVPDRPYRSDADLRETMTGTPESWLMGTATGS